MRAQVLEPGEGLEPIPSDEADGPTRYRLPRGATCCVTNDPDRLALADRFPVLTPEQFWTAYG